MTLDRDGMLRCTRPNNAKSYKSATKLQQYLDQVKRAPPLEANSDYVLLIVII